MDHICGGVGDVLWRAWDTTGNREQSGAGKRKAEGVEINQKVLQSAFVSMDSGRP